MMKPIGKHLAWAGLLLIFACAASRAEVAGTVDRTSIALGDTLRFTISATEDGEDISSVDLSPLQRDFEVLQRSTNSSTSIVNGRRSHSRKLIMEITPRREGNLRIPALKVGTKSTTAIAIKVAPQAAVAPGNATVLFEAVVDRDSVYVQGQLLLTLRLQQSVNLDARSISELELDNAFVIPLEQEYIDEMRKKLEKLREQSQDDWFSHSSLEATDNLKQNHQTEQENLKSNLQRAERSLNALQNQSGKMNAAQKQRLLNEFDQAVKKMQQGGMKPNKELLEQLKKIDPEQLNQLTPEQMEQLRENMRKHAQGLGQGGRSAAIGHQW